MVLEVAILDIVPGHSAEFEAAFARDQHIISSMPGYLSHELRSCLEMDNRYILFVRWESVEAHTEGFRGSPQYLEWKVLLHHFYEPFPEVHHYLPVDLGPLGN